MRFFKLITVVIVTLLFIGCEYSHESRIINDSSHDLELIIRFNKKSFENNWNGASYIPYLEEYGVNSNVTLLSFDTINLISHYKLKAKSFFSIDQGIDGKKTVANYDQFNSLIVINGVDTIIANNQQEFKNRFKPDGKNNFAWVIK